MSKIDQVEWAKIIIEGKEYSQVLLVGNEVIERDSATLHQLFGTTHKMSDFEIERLLEGEPEIIIVGNGWDGALEINEKLKMKISSFAKASEDRKKLGIELKVLRTPEAVEEYNRLEEEGKRVNALIHTTC